MSYLNKMYGRQSKNTAPASDKNPNRVTGGLKAQGVDRFTMLGEDGTQQEVPSLQYVTSLEEQSRKQRAAITTLERKLTRLDTTVEQLKNVISRS
jgi:ABC-type hemin transport system substrate-binding protein